MPLPGLGPRAAGAVATVWRASGAGDLEVVEKAVERCRYSGFPLPDEDSAALEEGVTMRREYGAPPQHCAPAAAGPKGATTQSQALLLS